mgnify:CR=1 FL=1|tara:strand:+ start:515 stop:700 length:186 start_codon:yes stop_codon:yes gene_type:complete
MPFYSYKCPTCDKEKEVLQGMNDKPPTCDGVEMKRIFKNVGKPLFKGKGFYETDYKVKDKP